MRATTGCATMARVRILLDYRPALASAPGSASTRTRSPPRSAAAARPTDTLTLFSSSWKDRLTTAASRRPRRRCRGSRSACSTSPGTAWSWPPVERFAGPHRHRALASSAADAGPRAPPASSPSTTCTSSIIPSARAREIRRDYPALAAGACAPRRRGRHHLGLHRRRGRAPAGRAARAHRPLPARRAGVAAARPRPAPHGPILFMGTLEPRKNVGALLRPTPGCSAAARRAAAVCSPAAHRRAAPGSAIAEAAARRSRRASRLRRRPSALRPLRQGVDAGAARRISKGSACRRSRR